MVHVKYSQPANSYCSLEARFIICDTCRDYNVYGMIMCCDKRMKKGPAHHWDLMIVAVLNAVLAVFGLPMVHGALPHSPLHVRAMADVEDRVLQGHVYLKSVTA